VSDLLDLTLELHGRWADTRACWLDLERLAGLLDDEELNGRVACARLAMLDVRDRLEQLLDTTTESERTAA
jgi:hypothetical protein